VSVNRHITNLAIRLGAADLAADSFPGTFASMIAKSSQSIMKKTLAPVVLVAALWITMSSATTFYVQWLQRSHETFFSDNIVSKRAAESLQTLVWRLAAEFPDDPAALPAFRRHWNEVSEQLTFERQRLGQSAFTEEEKSVLTKLDTSLSAFRDGVNRVADRPREAEKPSAEDLSEARQKAIEHAGRIAASAAELLRINQRIASEDEQRLHRISRYVLFFRLIMLVFGPLLGVYLGWRLAIQLHRSIARISVTLHDAGSSSENDVGTVAIESSGDFHDVQQQAEHVAERMRQVSRDLQIARREVVQAERLAAVGELAAGVAHEIRNPLTSVKLLLQHAFRQSAGNQFDHDKSQLILEEIARMESTIQGLLDFSRPPKLNRVTHDFRQVLRRALNLLESRAHQQGIEIVASIPDYPLMVDGDAERLHQVLVNLLINAIEAMPQGGRLSIEAAGPRGVVQHLNGVSFPDSWDSSQDGESADELGMRALIRQRDSDTALLSVRPDTTEAGGLVTVVIRDTGEGIPAEVLPRLFEPFATTKERGTGLGLAVSRRIVEEHRGSLQALNDPNGGAQFILSIPAATELPDYDRDTN
jgi:signal transduction histidine kinase